MIAKIKTFFIKAWPVIAGIFSALVALFFVFENKKYNIPETPAQPVDDLLKKMDDQDQQIHNLSANIADIEKQRRDLDAKITGGYNPNNPNR